MHSPLFSEVSFSDLPGWREDDHVAAFAAFRRSAEQVLVKPYRSGSLGIDFDALAPVFEAARSAGPLDREAARGFFEEWFRPSRIGAAESGFVTGFYEPEIAGSAVPDASFRVPFLRKPDDLVAVDETNRPAGLPADFAFARAGPDGLTEYYDRSQIEDGALDGRGLEIAYVEDPVDAFFAHVQGAARLLMRDGSVRRITYAAKSGHPFTGAGRVLIDLGEIPQERISMQAIRDWLARNPRRVSDVLWKNRSYIFFREAPVDDPALGPVAAAKVPLTAGRSMAVDRLLHTFGTPFFVHAPSLLAFGGTPFRRLMIAQDTGTAIVGPARGDLFAGSGPAAGDIAGFIRHAADFYALVPKSLLPGRSS
jgi:membrane-bound lytic murein transglycosylase A